MYGLPLAIRCASSSQICSTGFRSGPVFHGVDLPLTLPSSSEVTHMACGIVFSRKTVNAELSLESFVQGMIEDSDIPILVQVLINPRANSLLLKNSPKPWWIHRRTCGSHQDTVRQTNAACGNDHRFQKDNFVRSDHFPPLTVTWRRIKAWESLGCKNQ